jgi:hypothetical protein
MEFSNFQILASCYRRSLYLSHRLKKEMFTREVAIVAVLAGGGGGRGDAANSTTAYCIVDKYGTGLQYI